ncbi:tetratricopeptide repeat protein [Roseivirga misakiensis]|nr:SEL1-like repeat protein [Roseivirga misakiensis]
MKISILSFITLLITTTTTVPTHNLSSLPSLSSSATEYGLEEELEVLPFLIDKDQSQGVSSIENISIIKENMPYILLANNKKKEQEENFSISGSKVTYNYGYFSAYGDYKGYMYSFQFSDLKEVELENGIAAKLVFNGEDVTYQYAIGKAFAPAGRARYYNKIAISFTNMEAGKLVTKALQRVANGSLKNSITEMDKTLVPSNKVKEWVSNYGLQNLIDQAEDGNAVAQRRLGRYYRFVAKNDEEAVKWYEKAANQLDFYALGNLAYHLENGYGVEVDKEEAAYSLAFKNAIAPYGESRINGIRGLIGLDNARNLIMEVLVEELIRDGDLFEITDDKDIIGNVFYNVAEFFETGVASDYPKDLSKARAFYDLASDYGHEHAKIKLATFKKK